MILWKELFLARPYLLFVHTYSMKSYIHKTSHSGVHLVCIVQFSKVTRHLATRLSYRIHFLLSTSFSLKKEKLKKVFSRSLTGLPNRLLKHIILLYLCQRFSYTLVSLFDIVL